MEWENFFGNAASALEIAESCNFSLELLIEAGIDLAEKNWPEALREPQFHDELRAHAIALLKDASYERKINNMKF